MVVKSFKTSGALEKNRIFKFDDEDYKIKLAASSKDLLMGITDELGSINGGLVEGHMANFAEVEFGGTVARGEAITSDSIGRAVKAIEGDRIIGYAMASSALGDISPVLIDRSNMPTGAQA